MSLVRGLILGMVCSSVILKYMTMHQWFATCKFETMLLDLVDLLGIAIRNPFLSTMNSDSVVIKAVSVRFLDT